MTEALWNVAQVAQHFEVSESRARAILAEHRIERVTGYPANAVQAIQRPGQGARTDLNEATMFDATDLHTRQDFRFRSLDTLVRRYGGTTYQLVHEEAFAPTQRRVEILRRNRRAGDYAFDVLAVISVPSEAVDSSAGDE